MMLYAKGIEVEIVEPSGIHDTNAKGEFMQVNPLGRVPALQLDDGRVLIESEVICEYLEDAFPEPPLMPSDPWQRSQVRLISRISDIYIVMAMLPLFILAGKPTSEWDQDKILRALKEIDASLDYLEAYIGEGGYAVGNALSHADGTLVPILLLVEQWLPVFRGTDLMASHPKVQAYWQAIQKDKICAKLIEETSMALKKSMNGS
jgi:glutathione S-transferase